jgi:multimeric flavodoxin WrbA
MKILIINGSPRKQGVSSQILEVLRNSINSSHEVDYCSAYSLSAKPCLGCLKCRPDGICVLPQDGAHEFGEKIRNADMIIVAAPTFWGNIPGPLKTLFDRNVTTFEIVHGDADKKLMERIPKSRLKGKKAVIIVSSASPFPFNYMPSAGTGASRALSVVLKSGGVKVVKTINIPDGYKFDRKKEKYFDNVKSLARKLELI